MRRDLPLLRARLNRRRGHSRGREDTSPGSRHHVVVVGGGFGGLPACRFLGNAPVDVTLLDRRTHHLFQPLLYQVATGILSPGQIAPPLRHILRGHANARVELAEVTGFDLERRIVYATRPPDEPIEVTYDSLIVAAGVSLLGPMPAPMPRRAGLYRGQLLLSADERSPLHAFLPNWLARLREDNAARRVRWSLDVDPIDLY